MTREEAKDKVINYAFGLKLNDGINTMEELIDTIFDEHEALQQPKTCEGCKCYTNCFIIGAVVGMKSKEKMKNFYCNQFEQKDTQC